ncbi:hypothetical protein BZG02_06615 [Labilibaculum filiforme]|uniref:DUF4350 domain-containing protein n=1 Tax=Labilibaculum filiforme TaxID=1940526 RepID=A0A2N3I2E2_9BACT|nr:DUF4350 domain-containing protein [Labilibaculum filiforme]PKQ64474.1 hypothetical protein BZG02_06615 [Labilibaculum filiforme]
MKINIPKNAFPVLGILIILILMELFAPQPIDWTKSFDQNDKRPFGCFLLNELLQEDLFPDQEFTISNKAIFEYPEPNSTSTKKNYIFVTNNFSPQPWEINIIMNLAKNGNQVFIASSLLGNAFADSLHLHFTNEIQLSEVVVTKEKTQTFENPKLQGKSEFKYPKAFDNSTISQFYKDSVIVLGRDHQKNIQLVKIPHGKGNFYICSQPLAFTNYNVVQNKNANYIAGAFSYLPPMPIVWDTYYKPLRALRSTSPIVFLLSSPPLKLAYYLLLVCLLLVLLFQGKRQQKMIPILKPLPNTSLEFIRTMGRLYYNRKNHKDIALKKIKYLKEFCKSRYHVDLSLDTLTEVSLRSGISLKTLQILFTQIDKISNSQNISQEELEDLHSKVEFIYKSGK